MVTAREIFNTYKYVGLFYPNKHSVGFTPKLIAANVLQPLPDRASGNINGVLFLNYDLKNEIEDLHSQNENKLSFPKQLYFEGEKELEFKNLSEIFSFDSATEKIKISPTVNKEEYVEKVKKLKQHIQQGDIYEINYCIAFEAKNVKIEPTALYQKLNSISKAPYSALIKLDTLYIISSSPELFLSRRGNTLYTKPIKGTAKRGIDLAEDRANKKELQSSLKERTENVMIVDVARNDLSRIAKKGSVEVENLYHIETYDQVHQMVSTVKCEVKENVTLNSVIRATFPMASMTGAPKIRAMQLIDEYELYSRGPYSGCVGYLNSSGDFDLSVLIRSIFYNEKTGYLSFSVGSAITHLCDPEKEYEECLLKAKAMIQVLEN
jgi:para-aminobenzoate synthetase component 1